MLGQFPELTGLHGVSYLSNSHFALYFVQDWVIGLAAHGVS